MARTAPTDARRVLFRALDRKLGRVLKVGMRLCAQRAQPAPITVEIFFCAVFLRYRKLTLKFFGDELAFAELVARHCPEYGTKIAGTLAGGRGDLLLLGIEPELVSLLVNSTKLARAMRDRTVSLRHIAGALALDAELAARLGREGIALAGRVPDLPSGQNSP